MRSRRQSDILRLLLVIICLSGVLSAVSTSQAAPTRLERAFEQYQEETRSFLTDMETQLQQARMRGERLLAEQIEQKIRVVTDAESFTSLPRAFQPEVSLDLPLDQRELHLTFRRSCGEYAQELYLLARRSQKDSPVFAYELINLLLQIDPDHRTARTMRGYVQSGEEWVTQFERDQRKKGLIDHPTYGWIKHDYQDRYDAGERNYLNSWISAEKEALIRQDFRNAWEITTEHFLIKTNVSLEEGVVLGRKLETFYDYFKQTFAAFYNSPEQMQQLFDAATGRAKTNTQRYEVHFYRDKSEYVQKLLKRIPQIAMTNGLYQLEDRTSYFYFDPAGNNEATIFHEATHQLMYESHLQQRNVGREGHFWIVEGIACYMESFNIVENDNGFTFEVGNPRFVRFYWARHRLLEEDYFTPLSVFTRLGMIEYQTGATETLQKRYSQASGLSHFFMHYEDGKYRNALMLYLAQIYHSNPRIQQNIRGLDELTGVPYPKLDQQYRQYIQDQQESVGGQPVIQ